MSFPSIRIEGAILSGDLLAKLDKGDFTGQRPADFGFDSQPKLKEKSSARGRRHKRFTSPSTQARRREGRECRHVRDAQSMDDPIARFARIRRTGIPIAIRTRRRQTVPPLAPFAESRRFPRSHCRRTRIARQETTTGPRVSPHAHLQEYPQSHGAPLRPRHERQSSCVCSAIPRGSSNFPMSSLTSTGCSARNCSPTSQFFIGCCTSRDCPALAGKSAESLLERYHQDALESGARIRDGLSFAVEQVVQELGSGFPRSQ